MGRSAARASIVTWIVALGGTGFAAGFFGPIVLNPDANQGPLLGIFISGPGGALAGLVLGIFFRVLPVPETLRLRALSLSCAALAIATLYYCLPEPRTLGFVIEAEVENCTSPMTHVDAAVASWEKTVEEVTWATPPASWKQTAVGNVARDPGVVLTMRIVRRAPVRGHRKPWDTGRKTAGRWDRGRSTERYYARHAGQSCAAYLGRGSDFYWSPLRWASGPQQPADSWPPTEPSAFLSLPELDPLPAEYQPLLR